MKVKWEPAWYGLDQTIVAGDMDYFYLHPDKTAFVNDGSSFEDVEVYGEVEKILHPELGEVRGVVAEELYYRVYIDENNFIQIDAEENIGTVEYPEECPVRDWNFEVEFIIHQSTGLSSEKCLELSTDGNNFTSKRQSNEKYKRLLGVQEL